MQFIGLPNGFAPASHPVSAKSVAAILISSWTRIAHKKNSSRACKR